MTKEEIKEVLQKLQPKAKFIRIENNSAYYGTTVINTKIGTNDVIMFKVSLSEIGNTIFWRDMDSIDLIKWLL